MGEYAVIAQVLGGLRPPRPNTPHASELSDILWSVIEQAFLADPSDRPSLEGFTAALQGHFNSPIVRVPQARRILWADCLRGEYRPLCKSRTIYSLKCICSLSLDRINILQHSIPEWTSFGDLRSVDVMRSGREVTLLTANGALVCLHLAARGIEIGIVHFSPSVSRALILGPEKAVEMTWAGVATLKTLRSTRLSTENRSNILVTSSISDVSSSSRKVLDQIVIPRPPPLSSAAPRVATLTLSSGIRVMDLHVSDWEEGSGVSTIRVLTMPEIQTGKLHHFSDGEHLLLVLDDQLLVYNLATVMLLGRLHRSRLADYPHEVEGYGGVEPRLNWSRINFSQKCASTVDSKAVVPLVLTQVATLSWVVIWDFQATPERNDLTIRRLDPSPRTIVCRDVRPTSISSDGTKAILWYSSSDPYRQNVMVVDIDSSPQVVRLLPAIGLEESSWALRFLDQCGHYIVGVQTRQVGLVIWDLTINPLRLDQLQRSLGNSEYTAQEILRLTSISTTVDREKLSQLLAHVKSNCRTCAV